MLQITFPTVAEGDELFALIVRHFQRRKSFARRSQGSRSFHSLHPTLYCSSPSATRIEFFKRHLKHISKTAKKPANRVAIQ